MKAEITRYLSRKGVGGPWQIEGATGTQYTAAVVIPACDEEAWLFHTLSSLAENPHTFLLQTIVLVVINHSRQTATKAQEANLRTLRRLQEDPVRQRLQLAWIDAASTGLELPDGGAGVARRLGFDRALDRLSHTCDPLLISLDADTLVQSNYLECLHHHFASSHIGGGVVPFKHQPAESTELQNAINRYELYLRSYVLGLRLAGSPYAFHTIGSALACRVSAYIRSGGMSQRPAGEDFYFLQNLAKTDGVDTVIGTCVYPAARVSARVPFGTGPTLDRLRDDPGGQLFYPVEAFLLLGEFLQQATGWSASGEALQHQADRRDPVLGQFLRELKLSVVFDRLRQNHPTQSQFVRAFHGWFDGLKCLRLLRRLCDGAPFRMVSAEEAVPALLSRAGLAGGPSLEGALETLRFDQNKG